MSLPLPSVFQTTSIVIGAVMLAAGVVVLVGWAGDIDTFQSVLPVWVSMKANPALALVLCGASLGIVNKESGTPSRLVRVTHTELAWLGHTATETTAGCSRSKQIGTDFSDNSMGPGLTLAGYQRVFRGGSVHDYLLELRPRDDHVSSVLSNATGHRDVQGMVIGRLVAAALLPNSSRRRRGSTRNAMNSSAGMS